MIFLVSYPHVTSINLHYLQILPGHLLTGKKIGNFVRFYHTSRNHVWQFS